jgi:hypothetical protein
MGRGQSSLAEARGRRRCDSLTSPQVVHDPMCHGTRPVEQQILRLSGVVDFLTLVEKHYFAEEPSSHG